MGLRSKLILAVVLAIAAGFATAGLLATRYAEAMLVDEVRARGRALLTAMTPPCAIAMANGEFEVVDNYLGQVSETRRAQALHLEYVMILDHRGRIYSHADPTRFGREPKEDFYRASGAMNDSIFRRIKRPDKPALLEVTAPIISGVRWGTLIAGFSLASQERALAAARWNSLLAAAALAAACGLVLFLVLTFSVLGPIRRLGRVAEDFAEGRLDRRVTVRGRDELARLGNNFNHMASELQSYTKDLERKVAERAAEIVEKNRELTELNTKLSAAVNQLEKLAITDGLTGLFNHRHFQERLSFEIQRSGRKVHPLSVIMIDVDHFKNYNDKNGHPAGDALLKRLAEMFHEQLRAVDLIARYGGEEFVIMLLDTELRGARVAAEKIRKAVEREDFPNQEKQPGGSLTVSLGVATYPDHANSPAEVVESADRALYEAKGGGRNRVVMAKKVGADG